jgi:hypothetical protein
VAQRLEPEIAAGMVSSELTLSFWAKNTSGNATLYVELAYPQTTSVYTSTMINTGLASPILANPPTVSSWSFYTYTWSSSIITTAFAQGLEVRIVRDNSNPSTTRVTGVQLESGGAVTPFELLPLQQQLALCQRYFELVGGTTGTWQGAYHHQRYKVTKRTTPTLALFNGSLSGANFDAGVDTTNSFRLPSTVVASGAADYTIASAAEL